MRLLLLLICNVVPILLCCCPTNGKNNNNNIVPSEDREAAASVIIVQTSFGSLEGFTELLSNGQRMDVFYGIPYAQSPIGELRFEKPLAPHKWEGIRSARQRSPACVPHTHAHDAGILEEEEQQYSEDCLHLNVFAPHQEMPSLNGTNSNSNNNTNLHQFPVLLLIHGGSFEVGSAHGYDRRTLGESFVRNGIVVITVQYRLGVYGFASTGDRVMPGNLGLWDLVGALRWIRAEVPTAWAGDRRRITLMGHGAGAAAVSALSCSPYARDLFSQAIQMSGSILAQNAVGAFVVNETMALARAVNCPIDDSLELKQCLRQKSVEQIHEGIAKIGPSRLDVHFAKFTSREEDGHFFPRSDLIELIHESPPKRTLMGWTRLESLAHTLMKSKNDSLTQFAVSRPRMAKFEQRDFEHFVREVVAKQEYFGVAKAGKIQAKIVDFYAQKWNVPSKRDSKFWLERHSMLLSDLQYVMPGVWESRLKAQWDWPLFLYEFAWTEPAMFPEWVNIREAFHGVDRDLLFAATGNQSAASKAMGEMLADAIGNFVLNGNPSTNTFLWVPASQSQPMRHLHIDGPRPQMRNRMDVERLKFWHKLTETEQQFNLVKGTFGRATGRHDEL